MEPGCHMLLWDRRTDIRKRLVTSKQGAVSLLAVIHVGSSAAARHLVLWVAVMEPGKGCAATPPSIFVIFCTSKIVLQ